MQDFVIVNDSDNTIEIEYAIKDSGMMPQEDLFLPQTTTLANWRKWFRRREWQPKPPAEYDFVDNEGKFKVKLKPKEVLLIEREDSFFINEDSENGYDLRDLRIRDDGKEIYFENSKRLLEEFKNNEFAIIYK